MYQSEIGYLDLKSANSIGIPGYRRHVLYSQHEYGVSVGDFSSRTRFGFVVYKPGAFNSGNQIRVELKVVAPAGENVYRLKDIDPDIIANLIETSNVENKPCFIKEGNTGYFLGYKQSTYSNELPWVLTCTNAAYFLDMFGDDLALMLLGTERICTQKDAEKVNDLLIAILAFSKEMNDGESSWGTSTYNIAACRNQYNKYKKKIGELETEMNFIYEGVQNELEVLSKYGIDESKIAYS